MGNILFTVFGTLAPKTYNLCLLLIAIGFFGVYVPWNERKKKQGGQGQTSAGGTQKRRKRSAPPMSPLKAFGVIVLCGLILWAGLGILIAAAVMGAGGMTAVGLALTIFSLWGMLRAGRDFRAGRKPPPPPRAPSAKNAGEQPVPSAPYVQRRREQLETLKEAGILTREEYDQRLRELEKED